MAYDVKGYQGLDARQKAVHKPCRCCGLYFWVRILKNHQKACLRRKREAAERQRQEWLKAFKERNT